MIVRVLWNTLKYDLKKCTKAPSAKVQVNYKSIFFREFVPNELLSLEKKVTPLLHFERLSFHRTHLLQSSIDMRTQKFGDNYPARLLRISMFIVPKWKQPTSSEITQDVGSNRMFRLLIIINTQTNRVESQSNVILDVPFKLKTFLKIENDISVAFPFLKLHVVHPDYIYNRAIYERSQTSKVSILPL